MVLTGVVFLIILSVLVLSHEFGHFIVGKISGIGVLEFALGLPFTKPIWSKKLKGGMKLSLYPLLFGGFVKLLGEEGETDSRDGIKGRFFYQANVWTRIGVVVAGVLMNFLLAIIVFYIFLALSNFKVLVPRLSDYRFISPSQTEVVVTLVEPGTPGDLAGLKQADVITSADGKSFSSLSDFQNYTRFMAGKPMILSVSDLAFTKARQVSVVPRANPPAGQGPIGVAIGEGVLLSYNTSSEKIISGLVYSADMLGYNLKTLASFVFSAYKTGNAEPLSESVSGPIGILGAVSTIIGFGGREAALSLLNLAALLSLSLGFMNILPIPALDGGRVMFLLAEALFGKKMAVEKENLINQIGLWALLGLIALVSYNDIMKLIRR